MGGRAPPPPGDTEGRASLPWTVSANVAAAACRLAAHRARTAASRAGAGGSRPSREKSSCWLSASASPVDGAGPLPSVNPRHNSGSVGLRDPGRWVTSKR
jgi:hypothetical protein